MEDARLFGYDLIWDNRRTETKERNNTNEIIDRATWRSGLFHWFSYRKRLERSRISVRKIVKTWCKGFLCITSWKGKGYSLFYIEENEPYSSWVWLAEGIWCSDRSPGCYWQAEEIMGLASAGLDTGREILPVWSLVWKRETSAVWCQRILWLCNRKVW